MPGKVPRAIKPLGFRRHPQSDRAALNYAENAVETALDGAGVRLDFSEESVHEVDRLLTRMRENAASKSDKATIVFFARLFGYYVGEVFRRYHGGKWGVARDVLSPAIEDERGNVHTPIVAARDHLEGNGSIAEFYRRISSAA
jgi:hypothetical protein